MGSTILIAFYLTRDTLHRWCTHASSPLARLSVVFFLSFCGLVFLSSYAVSIKMLQQRINRSGANLVVTTEFKRAGEPHRSGHALIPPRPELYRLFLFNEAFASARIGQQHYPLVEYMPGCTDLFPPTERNGMFLLPAQPCKQQVPETVQVEGFSLTAVVIPESAAGMLRRLHQNGAVFVPYGSLGTLWEHGYIARSVLRLHHADADHVLGIEQMLRLMAKLDERQMSIISSGSLLAELGQMERTQYSCRVWITVGISCIICLLLTSISTLEYRQSSHVYALIGSFGISRAVLYLNFIVENMVLVALGFVGSLAAMAASSSYVVTELFKEQGISLSLRELENDIRTFCLAFGICIFVSSIPIGIAATRPIGKVLK